MAWQFSRHRSYLELGVYKLRVAWYWHRLRRHGNLDWVTVHGQVPQHLKKSGASGRRAVGREQRTDPLAQTSVFMSEPSGLKVRNPVQDSADAVHDDDA